MNEMKTFNLILERELVFAKNLRNFGLVDNQQNHIWDFMTDRTRTGLLPLQKN
jgi:hypothetical protein